MLTQEPGSGFYARWRYYYRDAATGTALISRIRRRLSVLGVFAQLVNQHITREACADRIGHDDDPVRLDGAIHHPQQQSARQGDQRAGLQVFGRLAGPDLPDLRDVGERRQHGRGNADERFDKMHRQSFCRPVPVVVSGLPTTALERIVPWSAARPELLERSRARRVFHASTFPPPATSNLSLAEHPVRGSGGVLFLTADRSAMVPSWFSPRRASAKIDQRDPEVGPLPPPQH